MSGYFNAKAERQRKERETPERILHLARSKGLFTVSLRYRDDWLRARCMNLKGQGLLTGGRRRDGQLVFYPTVALPPGDRP